MVNHELGKKGELLARNYLVGKGMQIRCVNYRFRQYEIDIIAEYGNRLVIVEVKARRSDETGEPWRAVTRKKQVQLIACANHYIQSQNLETEVRFDIVSIVCHDGNTRLEHIEDAFSA